MTTPIEEGAGKVAGVDWSRVNQWALWIGLAAAVALMAYRHNAHFVQLLPFLALLACPLMHLFGHGGHEPGRRGDEPGDTQPFIPEHSAGQRR